MSRHCAVVLCVLGLVFAGVGAARAATPYYFSDMGTFGSFVNYYVGSVPQAGGINNGGVAVGYVQNLAQNGNANGFYFDGTIHDLGENVAGAGSPAYAINAGGQIAGWTYEPAGSYQYGDRCAYRYSNGTFTVMTNLGRSTNGLCSGYGYAINDAGLVGGSSQNYVYDESGNLVSNLTHAVIWNADGSIKTDLRPLMTGANFPTPAGTGVQQVNAMNSAYAVGYYSHGGPFATGFMFNLTTGEGKQLPQLGSNFWAEGINDSNVIIGYGNDPSAANHIFAMKYNPATNTTTSLGAPSGYDMSRAYSINHAGDAVGTAYLYTGSPPTRAVLYKSAGAIVDLNDLASGLPTGWVLQNATAINDNGWIAGYGTNGTNSRGFLLRPAMLGDTNVDRSVDITDLSKVLTNYDKGGLTWADGDFDGNGTVEISDLSNVLTNYDKTAAASAAGVKAVPEPGTLMLLAAGLFGLLAYAWRQAK